MIYCNKINTKMKIVQKNKLGTHFHYAYKLLMTGFLFGIDFIIGRHCVHLRLNLLGCSDFYTSLNIQYLLNFGDT